MKAHDDKACDFNPHDVSSAGWFHYEITNIGQEGSDVGITLFQCPRCKQVFTEF